MMPRSGFAVLRVKAGGHLVTEGLDVVLRFGPLAESAIVACHIKGWPRILTASPAYLAKTGTPRTPDDLSSHDIIVGPVSVTTQWSFRWRGGTTASVRVEGRLRIMGNEGAIAAAVAGMGIVMTSSGAVRREIENGDLVRVLEEWDLGPLNLHAIFPGGKAIKRAARAFSDYLADALRDV